MHGWLHAAVLRAIDCGGVRIGCMRIIHLISLVSALASSLALAQNAALNPEDFAYGADIEPGGEQALQSIQLPPAYYQYSVRPSSGDVRVFNQAGQALPQRIEQPLTSRVRNATYRVPFFPVYGQALSALDNLSLQLERRNDGSLISIESSNKPETAGDRIVGYIIDLTEAGQRAANGQLQRLEFTWTQPDYGFIKPLLIEYSSDLDHWASLVSGQSLSRLDFAGRSVGKRHIDLPGRAGDEAAYLRLSWPTEQTPMVINTLSAEYHWRQVSDVLSAQTLSLQPVPITDTDEAIERGAYRLDTGGYYPLEQLRLVMPDGDGNQFYSGVLYSRPDTDSRWRSRGGFEQFNLFSQAGRVLSEPHELSAVRDRYWLIRWQYPQQFGSEGPPIVELTWRPERLQFLAQGEPPFVLAFGNAAIHAGADAWPNDLPSDLRSDADNAPLAATGEVYELGGEQRLKEPSPGIQWRLVVLWVILVIGVAVMFVMALWLYRQMNMDDNWPPQNG